MVEVSSGVCDRDVGIVRCCGAVLWWCIAMVQVVDRREAWPAVRHTDTYQSQRVARDAAAAAAAARCVLQCTAAALTNLPADIPFSFQHWNADDESPWHQYMLQYRTEYTYGRLGVCVQRGTCTSDTGTGTRQSVHQPAARYSADSGTDSVTVTSQSELASVKSLGRAGHRSAPASFMPRACTVVDDTDHVSITTVSLQLPTPHHPATADPQLPAAAAKSLLRCPAIRIHMNSSLLTSSSSASAQSGSAVCTSSTALPPPCTHSSVLGRLPLVVSQSSSSSDTSRRQRVTSSDSHVTFTGSTMRPLPANGFSIDDRAMLVTSLAISTLCS